MRFTTWIFGALLLFASMAHASVVMQVKGKIDQLTLSHLVIRSGTTLISVKKSDLTKVQLAQLKAPGAMISLMLTPAQIESVKRVKR